jgi:integrase
MVQTIHSLVDSERYGSDIDTAQQDQLEDRVGARVETVRVVLPRNLAYWSVLSGQGLTPVDDFDMFLRHLRFVRGRAESTTRTYATHLKRFEAWRLGMGLDRRGAAVRLADYVIHCRCQVVRPRGDIPTAPPAEASLTQGLVAIHGFYRYALDMGIVDLDLTPVLFEPIHLPRTLGRGPSVITRPKLRVTPRRASNPSGEPPGATLDEFAALIRVASTARNAAIVTFLGALGMRVGQVAGLRREDVHLTQVGHLLPGCSWNYGPHLHVIRREDHPRGAASKSRVPFVIPVPRPVERAYGCWLHERLTEPKAASSPWAFVSMGGGPRAPLGEALSTRRIYAIVEVLARRAGLRHIHPHMLRHTFGSTAAQLGVDEVVLQRLLGHASIESQSVYRHQPESEIVRVALRIGEAIFVEGGTDGARI